MRARIDSLQGSCSRPSKLHAKQSSPAWLSASSNAPATRRQAGLRTCSSCPATRARWQSRRPARRGRARSPARPGPPRSPGCGAPAAAGAPPRAPGAAPLWPAGAHPQCARTLRRSRQARPDADVASVTAHAHTPPCIPDPTIMAWGLLNEPRCEAWKARPRPGRRGRSPRPARRRPHDAPAGSCPGRGLGALQLPRRHGVESV